MHASNFLESSQSNDRNDIEACLLTTLSAKGSSIEAGLSSDLRRQKIRIAILKQKLNGEVFNDRLTFGEAYQRCYGQPLEMRRARRAYPASASVSKDADSVNE